MIWSLLAFTGAFGQAVAWAIKKQALNKQGINLTLGLYVYLSASIFLGLLWMLLNWEASLTATFSNFPEVSKTAFVALSIIVICNVIAAVCAFKAIDMVAYAHLMPFISVTAVLILPLEYAVFGTLPNNMQILGIFVTAIGGLYFSGLNKKAFFANLKPVLLFSTTLVCYTVASTLMSLLLKETGDPIYSATLMHFGIFLGFLLILVFFNEKRQIIQLKEQKTWSKTLLLMIGCGVIIAFLENGPIFLALEQASPSEVFSIKRFMPIFALLIGYTIFRERILLRHVVGTLGMVLGAFLLIFFS